jgi:uncharacterized membrane protein
MAQREQERRRSMAPTVLMFLVVVVAALRVASLWNDLPQQVASHWSGDDPDGWMSKGSFVATFAALIASVAALFLFLPWLVRLPPRALNIPNRTYWTSPERLPETRAKVATALAWIGVVVTFLFVGVLELALRQNLGAPRAGDHVGWMMAAYVLAMMIWLVIGLRGFRRPTQ